MINQSKGVHLNPQPHAHPTGTLHPQTAAIIRMSVRYNAIACQSTIKDQIIVQWDEKTDRSR